MASFTQVILLGICFTFVCISRVSAQLDSASVAQSPCLSPPPATTPTLDTLWFFGYPLTPYFVSNGSRHLYRSYAEVLLGRPANDQAELDTMDLQIYFEASYSVFTTGYGRTLAQQCLPNVTETVVGSLQALLNILPSLLKNPLGLSLALAGLNLDGLTQAHCVPWPVTVVLPSPLPPLLNINNGVRTDLILSSDDRIVWQSQKAGAVMITRCVNSEIADWKVLSLKRTVSPEARAAINNVVVQLGLDKIDLQ